MTKISLFSVVLLLLLAPQPSPTPNGSQSQAEQQKGPPNGQAQAPIITPSGQRQSVNISGGPASPSANNSNPSEIKITDWIQALANVAILIAVAVQACIYNKQRILMWKQWIATRRGLAQNRELLKQNEDIVEAVKKQAQAAVDAAKATEGQLEETRKLVQQNEGVLKSMQEQTRIAGIPAQPRVYVGEVRVENFNVGAWPVFVVSVRNDGIVDAYPVKIHLRVSFKRGEQTAEKYDQPQTVTIPARQTRNYFIELDQALTNEEYESGNRVRVSGSIQFGDGEVVPFCYKLYRFKAKTPEGVSRFLPCDFSTRKRKVVTGGKGSVKVEVAPGIPEEEPVDTEEETNED